MSKSLPRVLKSFMVVPVSKAAREARTAAADGDATAAGASALAQIAVGQTAATVREASPLVEHGRQAEETLARAKALEARAAQVLADAEEAAAAKLMQANEQVESMLSQAAEGAIEIGRQAREESAREGWETGYQEGLTAARSEATAIRTQALADRAALLEQNRQEMLDLVLVIAKQVIRAELTLRPEAILPMLEGALARLKGDENPSVRVSPQVLEAVQEAYGRLLQALPGARSIELIADPSLGAGDYMVQGDIGLVDGRAQRQLETIEAALREELE